MDTTESEQNIAATKASYKIKDKGLLGNYRDAKKGTAYTLQWMDVIIDWLEKIRNLIQWSDPKMTQVFLILLVIVFLVITFLPMRFILQISYFYKFWKGRNWQKKRIVNNQEVCRIELANFLQENKLDKVFMNYDDKWLDRVPKVMKRSEFEQRLLKYFQTTVKLFLPSDILTLCETPNKLIEYVGVTSTIVRLPMNDRNEDARRLNKNIRKKGTPLHWHLHNYIMSRIPSDLYLIRNPSLGLEIDPTTGLQHVVATTSKRLVNANMFKGYDQKIENS